MKRFIRASGKPNRSRRIIAATEPSDIHPALEEMVDEAYRNGYDVYLQGDALENAAIELSAREDDMADLTVWLDCSEMKSKNTVYYECKAKFPDIKTQDLQYDDSAEHILKQYAKAGKFITWLMKNPIELDKWDEE